MKFLVASILASGALAASVANAGELTLVHGIDGSDLGLDQSLPVDIFTAGTCFPGVTFGTVASGVEVDPGRYFVTVTLADEAQPCRGPIAGVGSVRVNFGSNSAVVAHLDDSQQITLSTFATDVVPTGSDVGRVIVRHTADAPAVDVLAGEAVLLADLRNGNQDKAEVPAGMYDVAVAPAGSPDPVFGPVPLAVDGDTTTIVYAVGSLRAGSFTVLVQTVAQ
jgi:hypothetical protein